MSAGAPWSVKGIDPKAREIAKDLARRSGMTLGEWLNTMIMEDGAEDEAIVPFGRRPTPYQGPNRRGRLRRLDDAYDAQDNRDRERAQATARGGAADPDDLSRVMHTLEMLSARLETAEHRTTLAIGGVDQAVAGLLARLETNERAQSVTAERLEHVTEDLRDGHGRMIDRLRDIEHGAGGTRGIEAMRALEGALGKIAGQVLEADTRTRAALVETREDLTAINRRMERVEAKAEEAPDPERLVEGVVARIAERLEQAEGRTSGAIRTLESTLGHLDERLRSTETRLDADRETRFEKLAGDLSQRVEEARSELVRRFDAAADNRFDQVDRGLSALTQHVQAAEQRSAQAIERMGQEVLRIAQNLNRRMTGVERTSATAVERVSGEMSRVAHAVEDRLRKTDDQQVQALEKLGQEIAKISERLSERIAHSERRTALTADDVGERIGRVADKLEVRYERASSEIADRIRQSEERTARLLAEARETIDRSMARADERVAPPEPPPAPAEPIAAAPAPAPTLRRAPLREEAPAAFAEPAPFPAETFDARPEAFATPPEQSIFEPAAGFPAFPAAQAPAAQAPDQTYSDQAFDEFFAAAEPTPVAAPTAFDDFSADTEFMSPQEVRAARPAVSTKEAIEAARAAARLGVRNSASETSHPLFGAKRGKGKLNERVEKETRREGSTVKKALLASGFAAVLASSAVGYWLLAVDGSNKDHARGDGLKVLAGDLFKGDAEHAPLAAVAYAQSVSPMAAGDQAQAESLYQTAVAHIADGAADGVNELSRAANLGYAPAQFFLASLYTNGESGVRKDPTEARRWTERAALGGDRRAMFNLGMYYFEGTGGPKDETEAANWFRKAADLGLVDSQYNLARLYEQGLGVKRDLGEAYKWYLIAGRSGDEPSKTGAQQLRSSLDEGEREHAERAAAAFHTADPVPAPTGAAAE